MQKFIAVHVRLRSSRPSMSPLAFMRAARKAGMRHMDAFAHHPYYSNPAQTPSTIIGCGLDPVTRPPDGSRLADLGIEDPFVLYLGRIDPNKGCDFLMRNFLRYAGLGRRLQLVMAGPSSMEVPNHASIRALGFVDDNVREALLARARVLVMPSPFESLSMVLLEAWNRGLPALVNARCKVLRGQVERANGGLYYGNSAEFASALDYLLDHPDQARQLGRQGLAYIDREYRWPIVMEKVERLLAATDPACSPPDVGVSF